MMFFIPPAILAIEDEDDRSFMENLYRSYYRLMTLVSEILLPSAVYCTSGALFDDGYSYSTITISDSIESDYSIYYHSNQSEAPDALIDHGKCYL